MGDKYRHLRHERGESRFHELLEETAEMPRDALQYAGYPHTRKVVRIHPPRRDRYY